ncbi:MAG: hypothetical protein K940chlam9_00322 [Chlamydiae bacterium]|nr:hypothetical protein [Chlamydiota bacterium]
MKSPQTWHNDNFPIISLTFLRDNMANDPGIDAGGLTRDYLDDLFGGLTKEDVHGFEPNSTGLAWVGGQKTENMRYEETYQRMGKLLMYCYLSNFNDDHWSRSAATGLYLDPSVFAAAFALDPDQILEDYGKLSEEIRLAMSLRFAEAENNPKSIEAIQLCRKASWDDDDIAIANAYYSAGMLMNLTEGEERAELIDYLIGALGGAYEARLHFTHTLAKGMLAYCDVGNTTSTPEAQETKWFNTFLAMDVAEFSNKAQGSVDKEKIATAIQLHGDVWGSEQTFLNKRIQWLQGWIQSEATEQELREMLKYLTGSTGLKQGLKIEVRVRDEADPSPDAHSCGPFLDLYPKNATNAAGLSNKNKQAFLFAFKLSALGDAAGFSDA